MTTRFKITWPSGLVETAESETETVDAYAMERWGRDAAAQLADYGVVLELDSAPAAPTAETQVVTPPEGGADATQPPSGTTTDTVTVTPSDVGNLTDLINP